MHTGHSRSTAIRVSRIRQPATRGGNRATLIGRFNSDYLYLYLFSYRESMCHANSSLVSLRVSLSLPVAVFVFNFHS